MTTDTHSIQTPPEQHILIYFLILAAPDAPNMKSEFGK